MQDKYVHISIKDTDEMPRITKREYFLYLHLIYRVV